MYRTLGCIIKSSDNIPPYQLMITTQLFVCRIITELHEKCEEKVLSIKIEIMCLSYYHLEHIMELFDSKSH